MDNKGVDPVRGDLPQFPGSPEEIFLFTFFKHLSVYFSGLNQCM